MNSNTETQGSRRSLEVIKWLVVTILLIVAIIGNYFYRDYNLPLRQLIYHYGRRCGNQSK